MKSMEYILNIKEHYKLKLGKHFRLAYIYLQHDKQVYLFNNKSTLVSSEKRNIRKKKQEKERERDRQELTVAGETRVACERLGCPSPSREEGLVVVFPGTIYATPPAS